MTSSTGEVKTGSTAKKYIKWVRDRILSMTFYSLRVSQNKLLFVLKVTERAQEGSELVPF